MKSHSNALTLIAAAISWNNSFVLASARGVATGNGVVGLYVTGLLLLVVFWNALGAEGRQHIARGTKGIGSRIKTWWGKNTGIPAGGPGTQESK